MRMYGLGSRVVKVMRRKYFYAAALLLLIFTLCLSYYLSFKSRTRKYEDGIFVELPWDLYEEERELNA